MKYIIFSILTLITAVFGIILILEYTDKQYQSVIAIAVSTATIQLLIFFLKMFFDNNSTKTQKAFNVIYDKRFSAYHDMFNDLFLAKLELLNYINIGSVELEEKAYNSIRKFHTSILSNKLLLTDNLYSHLNDMYYRFFRIYENTSKIMGTTELLPADEISVLKQRCFGDYSYLTDNLPFNQHYLEIEKVMRKELHIE